MTKLGYLQAIGLLLLAAGISRMVPPAWAACSYGSQGMSPENSWDFSQQGQFPSASEWFPGHEYPSYQGLPGETQLARPYPQHVADEFEEALRGRTRSPIPNAPIIDPRSPLIKECTPRLVVHYEDNGKKCFIVYPPPACPNRAILRHVPFKEPYIEVYPPEYQPVPMYPWIPGEPVLAPCKNPDRFRFKVPAWDSEPDY